MRLNLPSKNFSMFRGIEKKTDLLIQNDDKESKKNPSRRCSLKKGVIRNFTKFTRKHLCQSLFFNKVVGLSTAFVYTAVFAQKRVLFYPYL